MKSIDSLAVMHPDACNVRGTVKEDTKNAKGTKETLGSVAIMTAWKCG